jgi:hypothetical protein
VKLRAVLALPSVLWPRPKPTIKENIIGRKHRRERERERERERRERNYNLGFELRELLSVERLQLFALWLSK